MSLGLVGEGIWSVEDLPDGHLEYIVR
jgi:hypothetical protein